MVLFFIFIIGCHSKCPPFNITLYNPFLPGGDSSIINSVLVRSLVTLCPNVSIQQNYVSQDSGLVLFRNAMNGMYRKDGSAWISFNIPVHPLQVITNKTAGWMTLDNMKPTYIHTFTPHVLMTAMNGSVQTIEDFKKLDKQGKLIITSSLNPTIDRLQKLYGLNAKVIFEEAGTTRANLLANGSVHAAIHSQGIALTLLDWAIPLAVTSPYPMVEFPDSPTFRDLGWEIIDGSYRGILLPPGATQTVHELVSDILERITHPLATIKDFQIIGVTPSFVKYKSMDTFWKTQTDLLIEMVKPFAKSANNTSTTQNNNDSIQPYVIPILVAILAFALFTTIGLLARKIVQQRKFLKLVPTKNVTIMFTDIQDSTRLWEAYTKEMQTALELHNTLIRSLIEQHNGHEVKTQGDSFMIAFIDILNAVEFSVRLQERLLQVEWPKELIARETDLQVIKDSFGEIIWHGIKVRIGLHIGDPQVKVNHVDREVDYFGPMVNFAARVEGRAKGGQILISEEAYEQLMLRISSSSPSLYQVNSLGKVKLKGITNLQYIYQIVPLSLSQRTFPETADHLCEICNDLLICPRCDAQQHHGSSVSSSVLTNSYSHKKKSTYYV